jgi:hypothetical protein
MDALKDRAEVVERLSDRLISKQSAHRHIMKHF